MNICTFRLRSRLFGAEICLVKEVVERSSILPIPHSSPDVAGLVNLRGRLHLVLDLHRLFGFEPDPIRPPGSDSIVLFKPSVGPDFGVRVDGLGEVIALDPSAVEDRRAKESSEGKISTDERRKARLGISLGVGKTEGGLLVLLDPRALLPSLEP